MLKVFLLVVVGLAGDPEHAALFHKWGTTLAEASERLGVAPERLVYLVDAPVDGDKRVTGKASRDEIAKALETFAGAAAPEDVVVVTLIGHGSFDGRVAKFNLPGPDMAPADFNVLLKQLPAKQIVFVDTTSSSGPFVDELSGPGRTIVTATRNGAEQYDTLFGGYFVEAMTSEAADSDKNQRISVLEAFKYAKAEVARAYEREGLLSTEHALLDDDGDKTGTQDPNATGTATGKTGGKDGKVAAVVSLGATSSEGLPTDPALRALYVERRDMERRVEALRLLKDSMEPARYASALEKLVTDIALKTREIRAAEGK
jgi:hypothetical protein